MFKKRGGYLMKLNQSLVLVALILLSSCDESDPVDPGPSPKPAASSEARPQSKQLETSTPVPGPQPTPPAALSSGEIRTKAARALAQRRTDSYVEAHREFGELLHDMQCVGRTVAEARALLGDPHFEDTRSIQYYFEAGFGGGAWVLTHDGEKIVSITTQSLN
jgi:hypothetical protein